MATASNAAKGRASAQDPEWFMKSKFPVLFPGHNAFTLPESEFEAFLKAQLDTGYSGADDSKSASKTGDASESATLVSTAQFTTANLRNALADIKVDDTKDGGRHQQDAMDADVTTHPFVAGLTNHERPVQPDLTNKMLTENGDITYRSSKSSLVDLFSELEEVVSGPRLNELLNHAWEADSLATLKIIFNARSIHLGKSSRLVMYRCFGWLAAHHPLTLVSNLQWLSRPVILKKAENKEGDDGDVVTVELEKDEGDPSRFDVKHGVAHGYWKDLLNILALSVNGKLNVLADPKEILNVHNPSHKKVTRDGSDGGHQTGKVQDHRHSQAIEAIERNAVYRALHITVTRLFAEQLKEDLIRLRSGDAGALKHITLCAKWAPSIKGFHDKHTFVVSSISEVLHPQTEFPGVADRDAYLRRAREAYRKDVASLRKALEVVERDVTAQTFNKIKYERVPSVAMSNYSGLFATKDTDRFEHYIDQVAEGKKNISGAVLLPSKLVKTVRETTSTHRVTQNLQSSGVKRTAGGSVKEMVGAKMKDIRDKVLDGQWRTLVKRIKDSGTLESSIAVCDVSGSMNNPTFSDGTCPMDSAIGLSLLLAEVTKPPFSGTFIAFSSQPTVERVDFKGTLREKITALQQSRWGYNTDFEAVFEKLILPMAQNNKLSQEDMVKQIFVFSDMQFDQAGDKSAMWSTSYERIKKKYAQAGYEMPKLIFWNLAGGRGGYGGFKNFNEPIAPKPVMYDQPGTAIVSGYSQGLLKVFLDSGSFDDVEGTVEEEVVEKDDEDGVMMVDVVRKEKMDPLTTVMKAIGHKAYSMLKVYD